MRWGASTCRKGHIVPTSQTTAVATALSDAVTQAKTVITDNMPVVFGVAIAFVAWSVGRRVLGRI
jgi:hypothetical protein